jgi:chorismate mutase/prephenate dehydratase
MDTLEKLRERIDALDGQLLELITERAEIAKAVATAKAREQDNPVYYRPEREAQVLNRMTALNAGPLSDETVVRIYRELMSACLALQLPMSIAYLGPAGTFTEAAALKHFGAAVGTAPANTIDEVFRAVEAGAAEFGVVPVENSTEGVVTQTLDRLAETHLSICGEVQLRIHHLLLSKADTPESITTVYAHQQALAQCRGWLDANLGGAERIAVSSNAQAARLAAEEGQDGDPLQPRVGAIASEAAAGIYDLTIHARNIEDDPTNTTRFLVIGEHKSSPSGSDNTSLLFSTPNEPGALHQALQVLAANEINMTRIESRPSRSTVWEYLFFVDVDGHIDDEKLASAVSELKQRVAMIKSLGSYPRASV